MTMNYDKYDTILYIDNPINEAKADPRTQYAGGAPLSKGYDIRFGYLKNTQGNNPYNYGQSLRSTLPCTGGWSTEVADFGTEIAVKITYNNPATGRSASKMYLIVFDMATKNGKGMIKVSNAKWRSISDISQAASYIKGASSSLQNYTSASS